METRELTCICCPMGCSMTAEIENHEVVKVTGNTCPRGAAYAKKEITSPSRTVTSSVHVTHGKLLMASVKTKEEVPKEADHGCDGSGAELDRRSPGYHWPGAGGGLCGN